MQIEYNSKYLGFRLPENIGDVYVCYEPTRKYCFITDEDDDFKNFQRNGVLFKKLKSTSMFFEFVYKHLPTSFSTYLIRVSNNKLSDKFYKTPQITKSFSDCTFNDFIYKIKNNTDTGVEIMVKLQKIHPELHKQILGRGKSDLSDLARIPDTIRYSKFHSFIKKNW